MGSSYLDEDGAIVSEIVSAVEMGVEVEDYVACRAVGATHAEVLEALQTPDPGLEWGKTQSAHLILSIYGDTRAAGATHAEIMGAVGMGIRQHHYQNAREAGARHSQVMAVARVRGVDEVYNYGEARSMGASHSQLWPVLKSGGSLDQIVIDLDSEFGNGMTPAEVFRKQSF